VKEMYDNGVECSEMGEKMFTVMGEVVGHL
jgi:hypothetical protein